MRSISHASKYFRLIAVLSFVFLSNTAFAVSGTLSNNDRDLTLTGCTATNEISFFSLSTDSTAVTLYNCGDTVSANDISTDDYILMESAGLCAGLTRTQCEPFSLSAPLSATINGPDIDHVDSWWSFDPIPPSGSSLGEEIEAARQGFASTTGFDIISVIQWSGDNLIKLFIGSLIAIIFELRYWIAALIILGSIIAFATMRKTGIKRKKL